MFTRNAIQAVLAIAIAFPGLTFSQAPAPPVLRLAAETANLNGGPTTVRIDVLAWSTDSARSALVDAWNLLPPAPGTTGRGAGGIVGGRGARGARGGGAAAPEAAGGPPPAAAPPAGRGARGARGAPTPGNVIAAPVVPDTPEKALAAALEAATGVGYLWTSESTGYSLRYAYRLAQPDGGERIILGTDRRLGDWDGSWKPAGGPASDYAFSIIELRLDSKHEGEGKASVTGRIAVDSSANTVALEGYAALPITLRNVKPRSAN